MASRSASEHAPTAGASRSRTRPFAARRGDLARGVGERPSGVVLGRHLAHRLVDCHQGVELREHVQSAPAGFLAGAHALVGGGGEVSELAGGGRQEPSTPRSPLTASAHVGDARQRALGIPAEPPSLTRAGQARCVCEGICCAVPRRAPSPPTRTIGPCLVIRLLAHVHTSCGVLHGGSLMDGVQFRRMARLPRSAYGREMSHDLMAEIPMGMDGRDHMGGWRSHMLE